MYFLLQRSLVSVEPNLSIPIICMTYAPFSYKTVNSAIRRRTTYIFLGEPDRRDWLIRSHVAMRTCIQHVCIDIQRPTDHINNIPDTLARSRFEQLRPHPHHTSAQLPASLFKPPSSCRSRTSKFSFVQQACHKC